MIITNVRNILLIGNAGKGKSTLANVLTETSNFEESANRINGSDEAKAKEFEHEGIIYRVIDTVGTGVFVKQTEEILRKLESKADILSEGLNQILFVTNGRFTQEESDAFDLLRNAIFDDRATDFTTIVCTNFPKFEDISACEKSQQEFQKEIEQFSKPLASTMTIYVDNPPLEGRYMSMAEDSRKESRKILLNHLKTCYEVYRPELLGKLREMVSEFNSIMEDTIDAIKNVDLNCNNNVNFIGDFILERKEIVKNIEMRRDEVTAYMEDRSKQSFISHSTILVGKGLSISGAFLFPPIIVPGLALSAIGLMGAAGSDSVAILKEDEAYKSFKENLEKDKEKCKTLEDLQGKLSESIGKFEEIRPRFEGSKYKKQNINRERIVIIENVMYLTLGKKIKTDVKLEVSETTEHSTGKKAVRATIETICKLVPSPLSFYCMYRDHKEVETRDSLHDMELAIQNFKEQLKILEERQQLLNNLREKVNLCKEIAKLYK